MTRLGVYIRSAENDTDLSRANREGKREKERKRGREKGGSKSRGKSLKNPIKRFVDPFCTL